MPKEVLCHQHHVGLRSLYPIPSHPIPSHDIPPYHITDWLLTVAAVGDSKAVLDTGGQFLEVSPEHRVHHHLAEQARLRKAGSYLAPIR